MKIIVMSDSHGNFQNLRTIVERHEEADIFIHLGDGERDLNRIFQLHPEIEEKFYCLKGNCDGGALLFRSCRSLELSLPGGHRIFAAHGDYYQVKYSTSIMEHEAAARHADILLYGHTHIQECRYDCGRYIINPGSIGHPRMGVPTYAVLDVSEQGVLANIIPV